ncbi:hypothetical protein [Dyella mobilis]|nr:hypothetical protein [Dyella mobilis]GLQ98955.1 hypothetical protein GCM10007863_33750 [Dyella mobilis]
MKLDASLALVLFLAMAATSARGSEQVSVDPKACGKVPDRLVDAAAKIVGSDWPQYRPFMCLYPVRSPKGDVPLFLLALDVDRADEANSATFLHGKPMDPHDTLEQIDPIPMPAIMGANGALLGTLPVAFPEDPPATTAVYVSDWRDDFPHRIALRVDDPTQDTAVRPPYCPPSWIWNAAKKKFIQQAGEFYVACRKGNAER